MNKIERDRTIRILKDKEKMLRNNKEEALKFLIRVGVCDEEGKLTEAYK